jgi:parvulin-like peptidyl-prolyl isomerase
VAVTDDEIAKFFDENKDKFKRPEALHLQQIFIKTRTGKVPFDEKKMAEARQRADTALKRLQAGETFEAVAKSVSESPDRDKGGDMGSLPVTALPPFLTEAAASMKPGDISKVIESDLGLHVFKMLEVVPGSEGTLEKVGPTIRKMLLAKKGQEAVMAFCKPYLDDPKKVEVYLQLGKTLQSVPGFEDMKPGGEEPPKSKDASKKNTKPSKSSEKKQ